MADWHQAMSLAMEGPQASPLFRSTSSRMDCHWRLSSTGPAPELTDTSRLGCQLIIDEKYTDAVVKLPAHTLNFYVDGHEPTPH